MRFRVLLAFSFLALLNVKGATVSDTLTIRPDTISTQHVNDDLDSLVNNWYVKMALKNHPEISVSDTIGIEYPDSLYISRIARINSIVDLKYNSIIRSHIHVYTVRQRHKFCAVLGLLDYYFPMIEDIFDSYGIPTELKYMAVIESALNPGVVNRRSGATGMWQFMYSTGKMYGLTINSLVDERKDPVKSTHAAARYLQDLYKIYNDWILVIAAYDCGPGNVNKAIKRADNKKDYWDIYYRLPRETRGYIPQYVAAIYAITFYAEHNLKPLPLDIPIATDTIMINKDIHLSQISQVMGIPIDELKALNPQYKTGLVPGSSKPMSLTLPMNHIGDFIGLNDTIRRYKPDVYLNKVTQIADPKHFSGAPGDIKGKTRLLYTIKDGDNLGYISSWYKVPVSDLRYWNNIYRNSIRVGQTIAVYVLPTRADGLSKINMMTFEEKQKITGTGIEASAASMPAAAPALPDETDGTYITHTVRYGDTIWDIVKLYGNVTASEVLSLNNITSPGKIKIGQVLKIKKKS